VAVIDPKPLAGEREFAIAPIVRGVELGQSRTIVRRRLHRLTAELGLDRERARLWTITQTVAWSIGPDVSPEHLDVV
jgi:streptomycin 6-kinase